MGPKPAARSEPPVQRGRDALFAAAVLLAALAVVYAGVVFRGESLVFSNNYNPLDFRYTPEAYGPNLVPSATWTARNLSTFANFHDPGATWWQWEPGGEFLRKGIAEGEWPFWDPYVAAGAPALANLTSTFFFPPYLLLILLGNGVLLKNVYFLALILMAGVATYAVLREHDTGRVAALAGAVAFMFCGGLSQNVGSFIGQTAACMPVALYLTVRFVQRPTWTRTAVVALGWAAIALSTFPPLLVAIFGFASCYCACAMICAPPATPRGRVAVRFAVGGGLALALVAFVYVPTFAAMAATPQVGAFYQHEGLIALPARCLYQLISPILMGGAKVLVDSPMPDPSAWQIQYAGIAPCLLALAGAFPGARAREPLRIAALVVAVGVALKIVGVPPVQWLGYLPLLKTVHFAVYFGILLDFAIALLAGLGVQALYEGKVTVVRALLTCLVAALAMGSLRWIAGADGVFAHPRAADWTRAWRFVAAIGVATCGALLVAAARRGSAALTRGLAFVLLVVLGAEAYRNTVYPRQQRWDVWRTPVPYARALMAEGGFGRIFTAYVLPANASSALEVFGLDSLMAFNPPRIFALYQKYFDATGVLFLREAKALAPEGILDRADVELIAIRSQFDDLVGEAERRGYERRYRDDYATVFRRPGSPRYFFTSEYRVAVPDAALAAVGTLPPGREVLLEEAPAFPSAVNRDRDPEVTIRTFGRNHYTLALDAPRPGLVYCSESFFPGWTARVNGEPARIVPANYAFRAVEVPAGPVVVEMSYWPPGLSAGLAGTNVGIAIVISLFLLGSRR